MKKFVKVLSSEYKVELDQTQIYYQAYELDDTGVATQTGFGAMLAGGQLSFGEAMDFAKANSDEGIEVVTDVK